PSDAHPDLPSFPTRRSSDLLDAARKTVLVFGGSQGGRSINNAVVEAAPALLARGDVQIVHQTGKIHFADVAARAGVVDGAPPLADRKSTRLNSSHVKISYAV